MLHLIYHIVISFLVIAFVLIYFYEHMKSYMKAKLANMSQDTSNIINALETDLKVLTAKFEELENKVSSTTNQDIAVLKSKMQTISTPVTPVIPLTAATVSA